MNKNTHLHKLLLRSLSLQAEAKQAEQKFKEAQQQLIEAMDANHVTTVVAVDEDTGITHTGTLVEPTTLDIDETAFKEAVGSRMWNKITVRSLNRKLLDARLTTGEITRETVAAHSTVRHLSPYVKFTNKT